MKLDLKIDFLNQNFPKQFFQQKIAANVIKMKMTTPKEFLKIDFYMIFHTRSLNV